MAFRVARLACRLGLSNLTRTSCGSLSTAQARLTMELQDGQEIGWHPQLCFQHHKVTGFACSAAEASGSGNKKEGEDTRKGGPGESETEVSTPDSEEPKAAGEPEGAAHDAEGTKGKQPDLQGAAVEQLKEELGQKDQQIETLNLKVEELQEKILRTYADMENVRERAARQSDISKKYAVQGIVKDLLDVADNLERADGSIPLEVSTAIDEGSALEEEQLRKLFKGLLEGVKLTDKILFQVLKKHGVEKYRPLNERFDPHLHNALFELPDPSKEPGTIAAVTKSGYKMHDRIVRPAEVGVVRGQDANEAAQ